MMTNTTKGPHNSQNISGWLCKGSSTKPHPEIENWEDNCLFPGCNNTREGLPKTTLISRPQNQRKLLPILGLVLAFIASLGGGTYVSQKLKPCPKGFEKQNETCVAIDNLASNTYPNSSNSNSTLAPKNLSPTKSNNSRSSAPKIAFNPNWISHGDRVLLKESSNKDRDLGIEAYKSGNYSDAIKYFEKAVFSNRNDPEVQIYLNNAKAAFQGLPLKIATVVPIESREASAKEMLRGIADAQTQFNDAGGIGGRLVQLVIANDGNEPNRAQSIAQQLANDPNILGVIGHNSSSASEAALAEYAKVNLVMISPTSTSTSIQSKYFFRTLPSDAASGKKLAEYAKNIGVNKVAVFYNPNSSYSKSLQQAFEAHFQQLGGNVLGSIDLSDSSLDPKQQIQNIPSQVDAIALFPNTDTTSVAIGLARANTELSPEKLPMLGGDTLYSSQTLNDGGSAVNELVIAVPWYANSQPYAKQANQRWLGTVNWRTAASFDATQALLKTLETNPTRTSVLQNLQTINLSASETSGKQLSFASGERLGKPVLVQIVPGAVGKPRDLENGFKLINK